MISKITIEIVGFTTSHFKLLTVCFTQYKFENTIFEPVAKAIALNNLQTAQQIAGTRISSKAFLVIEEIMTSLTIATISPDKLQEIEAIRAVCRPGEMRTVRLTKVDIKLSPIIGGDLKEL